MQEFSKCFGYNSNFANFLVAFETQIPGETTITDIGLSRIGPACAGYMLTVSKAGSGRGTVTSSPPGIECGSDCSETYGSGTIVTLAATAETDSTFIGWSGDCSERGACTVTMDSEKNVTATFDLKEMQCSYFLDPTEKALRFKNKSFQVRVTATGDDCAPPSVSSESDWISAGVKSFIKNKGTVKVTVLANTVSQQRTGIVNIGGEVFTVTQAGAPCKIAAIEPVRGTYNNLGGAGSIAVTAPELCEWTAAPDTKAEGWVNVISGGSGTGSGTVAYNVEANETGKNRGGKVIIISLEGCKKSHTAKQTK